MSFAAGVFTTPKVMQHSSPEIKKKLNAKKTTPSMRKVLEVIVRELDPRHDFDRVGGYWPSLFADKSVRYKNFNTKLKICWEQRIFVLTV